MTRAEVDALAKGALVYRAWVGQDANNEDRVVIARFVVASLAAVFVTLKGVAKYKGVETLGRGERVQRYRLVCYSLTGVAAVERLLAKLTDERESHYRQAKEADARRALADSWLHLNKRSSP